MTVNQLRALLRPLYGLSPVQIEIMPCIRLSPAFGRPAKDIAEIIGVRRIAHSGAVLIQIEREHDC